MVTPCIFVTRARVLGAFVGASEEATTPEQFLELAKTLHFLHEYAIEHFPE